jgi:hypothetical protein
VDPERPDPTAEQRLLAALLALAGTPFRYPFTLRIVRCRGSAVGTG